jgi:hypothetical protein
MSTEAKVDAKTAVLNFRVSPDPSPRGPLPDKKSKSGDLKSAIVEELRSKQKSLSDQLEQLSKRLDEFENPTSTEPSLETVAESAPNEERSDHKVDKNDMLLFLTGAYKLLTCSPIMIFLIVVPFALASSAFSSVVTFVLCMIAIMPLAKLLGEATASCCIHFDAAQCFIDLLIVLAQEELALYIGQTLGGLLNASFG